MVNINYSEPIGKINHTTLRFEWRKSYRVLHPSLPQRNIWCADLDSMLSAAAKILHLTGSLNTCGAVLKVASTDLCQDTFQYLGSQHHVAVHLGLILNFERYGKDTNVWDTCKLTTDPSDYEVYRTCRNKCTKLKRAKRSKYEER